MIRRLLAVALLSATSCLSWADPVPANMQGIWASPNCEQPAQTMALFNGFYLWIGEETTFLSGIQEVDRPKDGWVRLREPDGYPVFLQVTPEGNLKETYAPDNAPADALPTQDWDQTTYASCNGRLPRSLVLLHGEPLAVLKVVDSVYGKCQADRQVCAATLFAGADVSNDGKISTAELARLVRVATYLAAVSGDDVIDNTELAGAITATIPIAPVLSSAVVHSFDYDNDGVLSLQEMTQDRGTLFAEIEPNAGGQLGSRLNQMKEAIKPLGRMLEGFGR